MTQSVKAAAIRSIGTNGSKGRRIWLEGQLPAKGGFTRGVHYQQKLDPARRLLTLVITDSGDKVVSGKTKGEREIPIIDILAKDVLAMFEGLTSVRVVVEKSRIHILPVASELRAQRRLARLQDKLASSAPLEIGGIASGIGILDLAAKEGIEAAGVASKLAFAVEIREDCAEHAELRNPAHDSETAMFNLPMQELFLADTFLQSKISEVDVLVAGPPCSGHSLPGRSKRGLTLPEDHPMVGHLIVSVVAAVARCNPVALVVENVTHYATAASASILRTSLNDLGYDVHEVELDASDWNLLEHRRRWALVAVTKGIAFSFDSLEKPVRRETRFGEIMDEVPPEASTWGRIDYLWNKLERDSAAGKGFAPTVVNADSPKLGTLNATLHKRQSTGMYIQHPTNPDLYRIPTVAEHARAKGIDPAIVAGTTQQFGHESLGQSVSKTAFVALFKLLGHCLKGARDAVTTPFMAPERIAA